MTNLDVFEILLVILGVIVTFSRPIGKAAKWTLANIKQLVATTVLGTLFIASFIPTGMLVMALVDGNETHAALWLIVNILMTICYQTQRRSA
jgi:hypothetical protein